MASTPATSATQEKVLFRFAIGCIQCGVWRLAEIERGADKEIRPTIVGEDETAVCVLQFVLAVLHTVLDTLQCAGIVSLPRARKLFLDSRKRKKKTNENGRGC